MTPVDQMFTICLHFGLTVRVERNPKDALKTMIVLVMINCSHLNKIMYLYPAVISHECLVPTCSQLCWRRSIIQNILLLRLYH